MYNEMTPITVYSFNPVHHFDSFVDEFTDKDVAKWLPGPVGQGMLQEFWFCLGFTVNSPTDQLADTNSPTYKIE